MQHHFENFDLRPFQREAIDSLRKPAHVICTSPTGSGKSLIYETLAKGLGVRSLLVTPLVALARQQAARLRSAGVPTSLGAGEDAEPPPDAKAGAWIISPESLEYSARQRTLANWRPEFLVVDECHCLWDWGDGFRPAFNQLPELIEKYDIQRSLWLTATLPGEARARLREALPEPRVEIGGFALPERIYLSLAKVPWVNRTQYLLDWLSRQRGAGLVFVPTREATTKIARVIEATGVSVITYHAGMSHEERLHAEELIRQRIPQVVVATSAFGMGMDYAHLEWVVLWQAPSSLLALAQTIGRAGRAKDRPGTAMILWDEDDMRMLEWMVQGSERRRMELVQTLDFLRAPQCREIGLKSYFDGKKAVSQRKPCKRCDFCYASVH